MVKMGRVRIEGEGNIGRKTNTSRRSKMGNYNVCWKNGQKLRQAEELGLFGRISL